MLAGNWCGMGLLLDVVGAIISSGNPLSAHGSLVPLCAHCGEVGLHSLSKSPAPVNPWLIPFPQAVSHTKNESALAWHLFLITHFTIKNPFAAKQWFVKNQPVNLSENAGWDLYWWLKDFIIHWNQKYLLSSDLALLCTTLAVTKLISVLKLQIFAMFLKWSDGVWAVVWAVFVCDGIPI